MLTMQEFSDINKIYNNLYIKYNLNISMNNYKQTNDFIEIDELINNIDVSNHIKYKSQERKCYPSSRLVYATKELHDVIMNPKFSNYLHTHGSHDVSKPFDSRILATGLKYFSMHYLDKKATNPILHHELTEISNSFRSQRKDLIDVFIKKWTIIDRNIKINL